MKFTKEDLLKLNCTDEEISLIIEYQEDFPVLSENENLDGLCIDARKLWKQLNKGVHTATQFTNWAEKNIVNQDPFLGGYKVFYEKDNLSFSPGNRNTWQLSRLGVSKNYLISVKMAEHIAMHTGAMPRSNKILKKNSKTVRQYFLVMKKIIEKNNKLRAK